MEDQRSHELKLELIEASEECDEEQVFGSVRLRIKLCHSRVQFLKAIVQSFENLVYYEQQHL